MQPGICKTVTVSPDTIPAFSFDILPQIAFDLKMCDLVKKENSLLTKKADILQQDNAWLAGEKVQAEKQVKKERRKRNIFSAVRTVIEVVVIVAIVII